MITASKGIILVLSVCTALLSGLFFFMTPSSTWLNSLNNQEPSLKQGYSYSVFKNFLSKVDNIVDDENGGLFATLEMKHPNGQLIHISQSGKIELLLDSLNRPDGLRAKNNKLYLVEESKNGRFIEYDLAANQHRIITTLSNPEGISAMANATFLISEDNMNGRIIEVTLEGKITPVLNHLSRPESIAVDRMGAIYFTETAIGKISKYADGKVTILLENLTNPDQLAFDDDAYLWIGEDAKSARLLRYKDDVLETIGENLSYIQGILPIKNQIFVAEQGRNRILTISHN